MNYHCRMCDKLFNEKMTPVINGVPLCSVHATAQPGYTPPNHPYNNAIPVELLPSEASQTELSRMTSVGQIIKNYSQSTE